MIWGGWKELKEGELRKRSRAAFLTSRNRLIIWLYSHHVAQYVFTAPATCRKSVFVHSFSHAVCVVCVMTHPTNPWHFLFNPGSGFFFFPQLNENKMCFSLYLWHWQNSFYISFLFLIYLKRIIVLLPLCMFQWVMWHPDLLRLLSLSLYDICSSCIYYRF